jgi:hypothetical protein
MWRQNLKRNLTRVSSLRLLLHTKRCRYEIAAEDDPQVRLQLAEHVRHGAASILARLLRRERWNRQRQQDGYGGSDQPSHAHIPLERASRQNPS